MLLGGGVALSLSGCKTPQPNLKCIAQRPSAASIYVKGFGLDGYVTEVARGALTTPPTCTVLNDGSVSVSQPYVVRSTFKQLVLVAGAPTTSFIESGVIAQCDVPGPSIPPGGSAQVAFSGASCLPVFTSCGLYQETIAVDATDQIAESNENDNTCVRYYYVPSTTLSLNIQLTPNPDALHEMEVDLTRRTAVIAPLCPPPPPVYVHRAIHVVIGATPNTEQFAVLGDQTVMSGSAGDSASISPALPTGFVTGPLEFDYVVTVPKPAFRYNSCTTIGPPPNHEDKLDTTITAISFDGPACVLVQKTLKLSVLHECQP